jgi:hypothetical protein
LTDHRGLCPHDPIEEEEEEKEERGEREGKKKERLVIG